MFNLEMSFRNTYTTENDNTFGACNYVPFTEKKAIAYSQREESPQLI